MKKRLPELCLNIMLKLSRIWSGKSRSCHKLRSVLVSTGTSVTSLPNEIRLLFCELSICLYQFLVIGTEGKNKICKAMQQKFTDIVIRKKK